MKWSVGAKIASGFGLTLAILLVIGLISYRSIVNLTDSARWVEHTHEVLAQLDSVLYIVKDAEDGERGYLLTGNANFMAAQSRLSPCCISKPARFNSSGNSRLTAPTSSADWTNSPDRITPAVCWGPNWHNFRMCMICGRQRGCCQPNR